MKRQTDGELDDSRLTEGITGELTVYKRRGMEKPELGRPQIKSVNIGCRNIAFLTFACYVFRPKRIRFVFDLSASMYVRVYSVPFSCFPDLLFSFQVSFPI